MHKEREGSLRFAKGRSQTMETLHGLKNKGVKVDLGIPDDLWDEPGAEVTQMKKQCEKIFEDYGDDIEEWYFDDGGFGKSLSDYLCKDVVLKGKDTSCLDEVWTGKELKDEAKAAAEEAEADELADKDEL